jgi:hypothetical protein
LLAARRRTRTFREEVDWSVIDSFDDLRGLDEPALRELLEHGRPEERVWAIWALALRSVANVGELVHHEDPDPGVRRNLAIVLAGHGELELLVALAHRDPAPEVRGAAMALVARLAIDGSLPAELVVERALADGPEVKIAVLGTMFEHAPRWLVEIALRLLDDRESDVRYEAFEALVRAAELAHALMWLEEAPESEARLVLMRWSARGNVRGAAERLAGSSRRLRRMLVEVTRVPTWAELAPAIDGDADLLRALLKRDPRELDRVPLALLVRATLADDRGGWLEPIRARLASLDAAPDDVAAVLPELYELCAGRLAELQRELERREVRQDEDLFDALETARFSIEATLDHISRLLVH